MNGVSCFASQNMVGYVTAKLNISEVAKLKKGKVFLLHFLGYSEKNNITEIDSKDYYWVTEDKIYYFNPHKNKIDFQIEKSMCLYSKKMMERCLLQFMNY